MLKLVWRLASGRVAIVLVALIALLATFGSLLAPDAPNRAGATQLQDPSGAHLLGTDYLGRDVLSRLLAGAPLSIWGALLVAAIALVFGGLPGILSVYLGRVFEWVSLRVIDTLIALPFLVFAVAMTALLGNGVIQALFAVGFLLAPVFYRVARAATLSVARSQYVEAAILSGASTWWIVRKHVWAKVMPPIAIALSTTIGIGLVVIASLTFLSIGVKPPTATWGGILASDLQYIAIQPYAPIAPIALILISVLACNLFADAARDVSGEAGRALLSARAVKKTARSERQAQSRTNLVTLDERPSPRQGELARQGEQDEEGEQGAGLSDVVLDVRDLRIANALVGENLVRSVSFALRRGRILGIVGESGSGKTLTCRAVLGILPKPIERTGGHVDILGRRTADLRRQDWLDVRGDVISAVFQDPGSYLNPSIPLGKQVQEVLRVKKGLSRRQARQETLRLFAAVHLREPELVYEQYVHELSGGMLQRVLIATAIALHPDILVADEATTALDVTVQAEILDLLVELKEQEGLSLVVVSHDLAVVAQLCDDVLVMKSGDVVEHGPARQVLTSPHHEYTKLLIAEHERYGLDRYIRAKELDVV
ncbi:peptide/nickel transport system permease protein [Frankia sp. AiPs1]|uniref:dipeptide/oligopeptide/nickel ABC transporter permease/ATP-binding protein n=1 Tax=Frankia sp. AiPa1 TaxID=573492 RepID=UPI00202B8CCA|nr:ATP-binding cassette domain-containing protein [Frankia sp. AiPa1]MCL9760309.1 dipeptide/oligopeptide/nickel ABC transporter permease/ATP-binding protein [Frankia sp. AiPa1]